MFTRFWLVSMHIMAALAQAASIAKFVVPVSDTSCWITSRATVALVLLYDVRKTLHSRRFHTFRWGFQRVRCSYTFSAPSQLETSQCRFDTSNSTPWQGVIPGAFHLVNVNVSHYCHFKVENWRVNMRGRGKQPPEVKKAVNTPN